MSNDDSESEDTSPSEEPSSPVEKWVKGLAALVALIAQAFPALGYFNEYMPPLWPQTSQVAAVLVVVVFVNGYFRKDTIKRERAHRRPSIQIACAIAVWIIYLLLLQWTTVNPPPQRPGPPQQIGFGMVRWSLTEAAQRAIEGGLDEPARGESNAAPDTPEELMQSFGVWGGTNPINHVWRRWTINLAGLLLIALFCTAVYLWSNGLTLVLFSL